MKLSDAQREIVRFGLVGAVATLVHYGIYCALKPFLPAHILFANGDSVAYTVGYAVSLCLNFYLSAHFTFGSKPTLKKAGGFAGAHLVNYLLHISLLNLFLWMGLPSTLAPIPVFAIAIPVNFLLVRFVFRFRRKH